MQADSFKGVTIRGSEFFKGFGDQKSNSKGINDVFVFEKYLKKHGSGSSCSLSLQGFTSVSDSASLRSLAVSLSGWRPESYVGCSALVSDLANYRWFYTGKCSKVIHLCQK